jgi:hypothetical protein
MKHLFLVAITAMWSMTAVAQCDNWIVYEEDKMTQKGNWMMAENIVLLEDGEEEGIGMTLLLSSDKKTVIWVNKVVGSGCIDENANVEILFTDKYNVSVLCNGKFNCDAKATIYLGGIFGKLALLDDLSTRYIETIRIWTMKGYVQKDLSPANQQKLKEVFACLRDLRD